MTKLDDYKSIQGKPYKAPDRKGYTLLEVLPMLVGKQWDAVALAYVHSLRPSYIRVIEGEETTDAICWRVTVYLEQGTIRKITQEVEVGLPEGVVHGHALQHALRWGLDSDQVVWHRDAESYAFDSTNGQFYKQTKDGKTVPFPRQG